MINLGIWNEIWALYTDSISAYRRFKLKMIHNVCAKYISMLLAKNFEMCVQLFMM